MKLRARLASAVVNPSPRSAPHDLPAAVGGKVVVVTGASSGIGRATAIELAGAGAHVLLVARSADKLEQLARELGPRAHAFPCDLAAEPEAAALAPALLGAAGRVDIVVSNAGKSIRRSVSESYDRMHDVTRTAAVNYHGPVRLLLGLLPAMRARGSGHVVNVSTIGVLVPPAPRWGPYVASKGAFDAWLRAAAAETAADGVTATSVYMALVHTAMSAPTKDFDNVPGLSPEQAARLIGDAIVRRPVVIAPWWAKAAGAIGAVAPATAARLSGRYGRSIRDDRAGSRQPGQSVSASP